ncbi:energy conserving hydrogenase EhbF [Methanothermobacter thermautotrophicus]|uniref:energy conserving hydrogenase EhbF n=1 Tax=Methanothermobacter thermautotrophicus TaxID=145262 RepID=UPI0022B92AAD|nr:energy conserving hydrogenase EhbF [Methanothermobacter thermautotrophicus]WBF05798.1 energy conserving hydrogenase EhbF [Methanothermobacter thermautotrophicus]
MNPLIPVMVVLPILCALLLNLLHGRDRTVKALAVAVAILLPIIPLLAGYGVHYFGGYAPLSENSTIAAGLPASIKSSYLYSFHPAITYVFGSAQRIFLLILSLVTFLAVLTSLNEVRRPSGVYAFLMFMGTAAVTAIVLTDDIFNLYVFFEIAALAQVGVVLCSGVERNYETALKYMMIGGVAAPMLLLGVAILLALTGNVNISDIVYSMRSGLVNPGSPLFLLASALLIFGWLYGTGLPPFHTIKSAIYSKALPHGSALLQAFSVFTFTALAIVILRMFYHVPLVRWVMVFFSLAGMVLGISMALMQTDLRRMIGFLAVGELGYIGIGLGLGTAASISAGLFQAVNEALITACIFLGFGTIFYMTGKTDPEAMGGLLAYKPGLAGLVMLSGFIMAGVPPFNVFQSKLRLIQAAIQAGVPELGILMILLSIVTFMTFMRAFYSVYLKPEPRGMELESRSVPRSTVFSMVVLIIICTVLGIAPWLATSQFTALIQGLII